ncbi:hypothetical protein Q5P01_002854 [Channa striata]|uniref:C-type lectin domain-containing protein n=1 Tax=Channa striata TaxID=64152 RepID=A0AA88NTI0_CHASR|nr:hypothetical protein Q5P01_002854 [Channa striata]
MKILLVCVLGCAVMLLVGAAADEEENVQNDQTERSNLVKRYTLNHRGWSLINGRYFYFVKSYMTWAQAERYCESIGATLASIHNANEHQWLQKLIFVITHYHTQVWIGGSDAEQKGTWLWSDGSRFSYAYWCKGDPTSSVTRRCLEMNQGATNLHRLISVMKILLVCVLGCAVMLLVGAAADEEETVQNDQTERSNLVKRYTLSHRSWSRINGRDFYYVNSPMTWAQAERYCQSIGANLASVHNLHEYQWLQKLIFVATHYYKQAWIGGSDAQQKGTWLWSDGSRFTYSYWCRGEPSNFRGQQHCLQINYGGFKCWDDVECYSRLSSICVKKRC